MRKNARGAKTMPWARMHAAQKRCRGQECTRRKTNEVRLPSQITSKQIPDGFYADGSYIRWNGSGSSYKLGGIGDVGPVSNPNFDTFALTDGKSYTLSVVAEGDSVYCYDSKPATYLFTKHAAPTDLIMKGSVLEFSASDSALLYEVKFQNEIYHISDCSLDLSEQIATLGAGRYSVDIKALPSGFMPNEVPSSTKTLNFEIFAMNFSLSDTTLSWGAVNGATGYRVRINDGEWADKGNVTSIEVTTDVSSIVVAPYNANGDIFVVDNVATLVALSYDANGGSPEPDPVCRLVGGTIGALPEVRFNNIIADWYDSADIQARKSVTSADVLTQDTTIYADYDIIKFSFFGETATVGGLLFTPSGDFSVAIPSTKNGKSVTSIAAKAFKDKSGLIAIVIPSSVTSIGDSAFEGCSGLTSITIPDSVTNIGRETFEGCSGLTSITYKGTKAQWKAIRKDYNWSQATGEYTVTCTDGTLSKAEAQENSGQIA